MKRIIKRLDAAIIKIVNENSPYILSSELFDKVTDSDDSFMDLPITDIYKRIHSLRDQGLIGSYGNWILEEPSYYPIATV